jgi:hypothetical protein
MNEIKKTGFFGIGKVDGRWSLIDPDGKPFYSIGLNHTDDTNLKYPYNIDIWQKKYGSRKNWIKNGLVPDMKKWGFNTIGWTQENIARTIKPMRGCRHSLGWMYEDYITCDIPYCVNLEIAKIASWDLEPIFPDVFSSEFDDWCAYLAREVCQRHKDSKNLIGYFLVDIPAWIPHKVGKTFTQLEGLETGTKQYTKTLSEIAEQYYKTVTKYIRQYDPNHLILGDRYNGNFVGNETVMNIAKKYVDVISIQYFTQGNPENHVKMEKYFDKIYEVTGKPLLLADIGNRCPTKLNPSNPFGNGPLENQADRANDYIVSIGKLEDKEYFIGWHWCAYIENTARGWGIKDEHDEPYNDFVDPVSSFNKEVLYKHK